MNTQEMTTQDAMAQARAIAKAAALGALPYEEAKKQAQPHLDIVNIKGREIAKRFNKKYRPITFAGLSR